ncbi:hypothetical protein BU25DRAFT_424456 [Macroventuria anomochaeta]|uniref:Uncharacterized protein n=1 Tax=Macroventuria anomochaeta TaxID=301207 RepID=A0ACB6RSF1_9PLEO|nr:uncharacterized protein BU25DRAFT_424456 [Macroventuria anomochaeta]KAF2624074.1 hypothetical protein BU25DRAFT_424456 [Macroventuria anomochaeta]
MDQVFHVSDTSHLIEEVQFRACEGEFSQLMTEFWLDAHDNDNKISRDLYKEAHVKAKGGHPVFLKSEPGTTTAMHCATIAYWQTKTRLVLPTVKRPWPSCQVPSWDFRHIYTYVAWTHVGLQGVYDSLGPLAEEVFYLASKSSQRPVRGVKAVLMPETLRLLRHFSLSGRRQLASSRLFLTVLASRTTIEDVKKAKDL